jgi:hypothetical protein
MEAVATATIFLPSCHGVSGRPESSLSFTGVNVRPVEESKELAENEQGIYRYCSPEREKIMKGNSC